MNNTQDDKTLASTGAELQEELHKAGMAASKLQLDTQLAQQCAAANPQRKSGKTAKQMGIKKATQSKNTMVEVARRIARDLAKNGPITIDDVTEVLVQKGYEKANPDPNDKSSNKWKGTVFLTSEWICVSGELARLPRSHARYNRMWALKSWVDAHSLNGKRLAISKFDIEGIRRDFVRANPSIDKSACHWFVGVSRLADDVMQDIKRADNTYDEVPVTFIPYAVGAVLQYVPPQMPVYSPEAKCQTVAE